MKIKDVLKKVPFVVELKNNIKIKKAYKSDYNKFKNNWIYSKSNSKKIGYNIILEVHSLEKGMTNTNPRRFGVEKVKNIMQLINKYEDQTNKHDFAYLLGLNALKSYLQFYEKMNWQDSEEYKAVKTFLQKYDDFEKINVGSYEINKEDFINDAIIDYDKFLASRHSVREYQSERVRENDVINAINMAMKTPSACNRQMCKIYYVNDEKKREETIKYGKGLTNFELDNTNIFVITFDISSYCSVGDRHQGWFNAGLISMNFVNALHSLGIGSCFIQFGNDYKEEKQLKRILNIPESEKISVIIAAGYYKDKSIIPYSSRKNIKEIYTKI